MFVCLLDRVIETPLQPLDCTVDRLLQGRSAMSHRDGVETRESALHHAMFLLTVGCMAVLLTKMNFHSGESGVESTECLCYESDYVAR